MAVTLKTVAERAGVSVMAASAALNNTTRTRLSPEKRARIRQIAGELGYRPNIMAQRLSGCGSRLIGVIIDSCTQKSTFQILQEVEATASQNGYRLLVAEQHESAEGIADICATFGQYGVDGIICLAHDYPNMTETLAEMLKTQKNIVFWEKPYGDAAPSVTINPMPAFTEILDGWRKSGRRAPALAIRMNAERQLVSRAELFRLACQKAGYPPRFIDVQLQPNARDAIAVLEEKLRREIIPQGIDAILLESDIWAAALLRCCHCQGLRVPQDLAVVGWDDEPFCPALNPPLASISICTESLGRRLAQSLLDILAGKPTESSVVSAVFQPRESCGFP